MKVGFIGLGTMGGPMALNVRAAGHTLAVYDLRRSAAEPLLRAGATLADGPREVG
ncbi:MAG: NAD(P)-binding domain-containing protein, partial [Burkholderiales bacterium]